MNSTLNIELAATRSAELQRAALDARLEARGNDGGSRWPRRPRLRRRFWAPPRLRAA